MSIRLDIIVIIIETHTKKIDLLFINLHSCVNQLTKLFLFQVYGLLFCYDGYL